MEDIVIKFLNKRNSKNNKYYIVFPHEHYDFIDKLIESGCINIVDEEIYTPGYTLKKKFILIDIDTMRYITKDIIGIDVYNIDNHIIGTVSSIDIDNEMVSIANFDNRVSKDMLASFSFGFEVKIKNGHIEPFDLKDVMHITNIVVDVEGKL